MIDYTFERNKYRPKEISVLLIGEAPPPNGKSFFYIPKSLALNKEIRNDTSLPSTIFNHYFGKRPENVNEYEFFLRSLQSQGVFLLDIIDKPLKIRGNKENENYLISQLPSLLNKVQNQKITLSEDQWVFLLPRNSYKRHIKALFPKATKVSWIDFRLKLFNHGV